MGLIPIPTLRKSEIFLYGVFEIKPLRGFFGAMRIVIIRFIRYHACMKIQIINSLVFNRRFLASAYEESPVDFR